MGILVLMNGYPTTAGYEILTFKWLIIRWGSRPQYIFIFLAISWPRSMVQSSLTQTTGQFSWFLLPQSSACLLLGIQVGDNVPPWGILIMISILPSICWRKEKYNNNSKLRNLKVLMNDEYTYSDNLKKHFFLFYIGENHV